MVASLLARFLGNSPLSVQVTWGEETLREPGSQGERGVGGTGCVWGGSARKRGVWPWAAGEVGSGKGKD